MPIFRINKDLHFFAHVPKCGGSSVELYLNARFGRMALHERDGHFQTEADRWSRTVAQHIPVDALDRLVPAEWIVSSFAVVRHPVRRLVSAFHYARDIRKTVPMSAEINSWFAGVAPHVATRPFHLGGHLAPQSDLVPATARIFRLEDGLEAIIPHLDSLAGNSDGPREIAARNVGKWRSEHEAPVLTEATLALIGQVYAVDFARFGYPLPSRATDLGALPDLPVLAATGKPPVAAPRNLAQRVYRKLLQKASMR